MADNDNDEETPTGRAIWKGSLSFGLVSVPVALMPATQSHELSFTMLDRHDHSPVGYKRYNKASGEEVAWKDIVKGYQYEKGEYVVLGPEDFKRANAEATQTVGILAFVEQKQIDPMYFETPYYLAPEKRGAHAYGLLRAALERTGKVGIATVVIRSRQHLAAVMPRGDILVLEILRFPHELRRAVAAPAAGKLSEKELVMAEKLIDAMVEDWDPKQYKDEYHDQLLALIERKAAAGETDAAPPSREARAKPGKVIDLMSLLQQSVAGGRARRAPAKRKAPRSRKQSA